jgi:hypothetical protein
MAAFVNGKMESRVGVSPAGVTWVCRAKTGDTTASFEDRAFRMAARLSAIWAAYDGKVIRARKLAPGGLDHVGDILMRKEDSNDDEFSAVKTGASWVEGPVGMLREIRDQLEAEIDIDEAIRRVEANVNADLTDHQVEFGARASVRSQRCAAQRLTKALEAYSVHERRAS